MIPNHFKSGSLTDTPLPVDSFGALPYDAELSRHEPTALAADPRHSSMLTHVEPDDLARFEGEGGLGEPEPAAPRRRQEFSANKSKDL